MQFVVLDVSGWSGVRRQECCVIKKNTINGKKKVAYNYCEAIMYGSLSDEL